MLPSITNKTNDFMDTPPAKADWFERGDPARLGIAGGVWCRAAIIVLQRWPFAHSGRFDLTGSPRRWTEGRGSARGQKKQIPRRFAPRNDNRRVGNDK